MRASVIIPTRDRPGPLSRCLDALASSFPRDAEVIVVSDGGRPGPPSELERFTDVLRLRYLATPHGGPAAARNRGLAAARGEIVAFVDDDCLPRTNWLSALASGVSASPPCAAGGATLNGSAADAYAEASQMVLDLLAHHDVSLHGEDRFFPSNNVAFPVDALRQIGGFDPSFRTAEDRDLCRRWRCAGFGLRRVPEAVVDHRPSLDLPGYVRRFFAYGRGAMRFHSSGGLGGFLTSAAFHVRIPFLVAPEVVRRGMVRGAKLLGLLALWEVANLGGFVAEALRSAGGARRATERLRP